jgi:hypothetical protein
MRWKSVSFFPTFISSRTRIPQIDNGPQDFAKKAFAVTLRRRSCGQELDFGQLCPTRNGVSFFAKNGFTKSARRAQAYRGLNRKSHGLPRGNVGRSGGNRVACNVCVGLAPVLRLK